MIKRQIERYFQRASLNYPIIAVLGPRQSGKTTFVRETFPKHAYINLEDRKTLNKAKDDPVGFLKQYKLPLVIDEIHRVPELLNAMPDLIDSSSRVAQIFLIGLPHPALIAELSKLGQIANIVSLLPLSIAELSKLREHGKDSKVQDADKFIYSGFMPKIYSERISPALFYSKYYSDYLEREVWQFVNLSNRKGFEKFIALLAERVGCTVNLKSLEKEVGVSSTTLSCWLNALEASCIIFKLPCFFKDLGKRQIKSPKIYFTDVGFAAYILGIEEEWQVAKHNLRNNLFENMIVAEAFKAIYNMGEQPNKDKISYFMDNHGFKIDLILNNIRPIEIKASTFYDFHRDSCIRKFYCLVKEAARPIVIYTGEKNFKAAGGLELVNFKNITVF